MTIGFMMDDIYFSADGLQHLPSHAALIGEIITSFSLIEGVVGGIYGMLRHQEIDQALDDLNKLSSNHARVQAVRKLIGDHAELSKDAGNDALMKRVLDYAELRNKVAHGVWGALRTDDKVAYRLPLKRWISTVAVIISAGTSGTFMDKIDALKAEMESYDLSALVNLKSEGEKLLADVFFLFNKVAKENAKADFWQEKLGD